MLVVLSLLLFVVAIKIAKQKNNTVGKLFVTLVGVSAIAMGGSGIKLITEVNAGPPGIALDMPVITLPGGFTGLLTNNNGQDVTIESIIPDVTSNCSFGGIIGRPAIAAMPVDPCFGATIPLTAPITVMPGQSCFVNCGALASDMRLKREVKFLKEMDNGLKLYSFKYISGHSLDDKTSFVGVMAQDLLKDSRYQDAVMRMGNDFYGVNYNALGLRMITLEQWNKSSDNILRL